ncbi:probable methyltransferase-like protein 25 [Diadema setosum]|uniref:probable methyltransferase-like protein 25 n=1 Tax=Diadema setosum TaxID=31175 RepID=UPI003B3A0D1F
MKKVIDVGSGKGYLGQFLSKQYGLTVASVDVSEINTFGALKRSNRLDKQWNGIIRNLAQRVAVSSDIPNASSQDMKSGASKTKSPAVSTKVSAVLCHRVTNSTEGPDSNQGQSRSCQQSCQTETVNSEDVTDQRNVGRTREESGAFVSLTGYVDEETDIGNMLGSDQETNHFDLTEPFMMVGLHTCGNLAPSMLRIFVANPSLQCLCGVGCCYHHVTEEFAKTDEWDREHPGVEMGTSYGFPMSSWLRERNFALGRGARMTACMAAERVAAGDSLDVKGLFYRAILQVICKEHYVIPTRKQIVGKLAPKCKTFLEYTRRALRKLGMDESKLSDAVIEGYEERYRPFHRNLAAYNQLRASLAPSIEALILLDRLAYLREQPNIQMASIVPLFDPVTSPRCYAILAVKSS